MSIINYAQDARYYLMSTGDLVFKTLPVEVDRRFIKKEWKFAEIGQDPKTFLEFLQEAYCDGAKEDDVIRIAAESFLEQKLNVKNVLELIGIAGKKIEYEYERHPLRTNPVKV